MKIKNTLLGLIIFSGLSFCFSVRAEEITNYQVNIQVNQDATVNIKESILYDFGDEQRHGILRNIPYQYKNSAGNFNLRYENISVKDENNNDYIFSESFEGDDYSLKIGDEDVLVTGQKNYIISYTVRRAIGYFSDHDELYWNAIGNEWEVPIKKALITMDGFGITNVKCFYGNYGDQTECNVLQMKNTYQSTSENLNTGAGITIAMSFNKGVIYEPTQNEKVIEFVKDNWGVAIPFIVFIFLFYWWFRYGRDPKGKGVIIAQYSPLPKLSPLESKAVMDETVETQKIASEIILLAIKKYLTIEKTTKKNLGIFDSEDYVFKKLKEPDANLTEFQNKLMTELFSDKNRKIAQEASLSDIKEHPQSMATFITSEGPKMIYQKLTNENYFPKNPQTVRLGYIIAGILMIFFSFIPLIIDPFFGWVNILAIIIAGIVVIVFGLIMPRKTIKGVITKEYMLGLKKYISVAEAERIKFHNAPEKNPKHFEELLPYAIMFGLEKEWAKKFEGLNYNPSWYAGENYSTFNAAVFASSINNINNSVSSAISTAGSGGSGFSGGGAGGGFGGGGGGSW
ncbi:MAG: DUF2207 domain-containing protein [Candidatus Paceibacterota bacterium]|jgi:hypothetical protein|nr:DUF2207 domain-containing protein [bacterium]